MTFNEIMKKTYDHFIDMDQLFFINKNMSEINMQKFLNTLCEFTEGKEDKDNFIQKALKVCKLFKVKPLKAPRPDVPSKKTLQGHSKDQKRVARCSSFQGKCNLIEGMEKG